MKVFCFPVNNLWFMASNLRSYSPTNQAAYLDPRDTGLPALHFFPFPILESPILVTRRWTANHVWSDCAHSLVCWRLYCGGVTGWPVGWSVFVWVTNLAKACRLGTNKKNEFPQCRDVSTKHLIRRVMSSVNCM